MQRAPLHEDGIMGLCVLVFASPGELGGGLQETEYGGPCNSGTGFVAGRSPSRGEVIGAYTGAPMEVPSSL